ncbi:unnamed protein product [Eretmochelys imbricata]
MNFLISFKWKNKHIWTHLDSKETSPWTLSDRHSLLLGHLIAEFSVAIGR